MSKLDVKIAYDYVANYKQDIEKRLARLKRDPTPQDKFNLALSDLLCDILPKQIPKKPKIEYWGTIPYSASCPRCGASLGYDFRNVLYCEMCGQALDWETESEEV